MKSRQRTSNTKPNTSSSPGPSKAAGGGGRGNAARAEQIKEQQAGKKAAPTAGPSQDDRYYGKEPGWVPTEAETLKTDLKTRILMVTVRESVGGLEVKFAAGFNQGLFEDMNLTLCTAKGTPIVDTTVFDVKDRLSTALLIAEVGRITPDMLSGDRSEVILRPR